MTRAYVRERGLVTILCLVLVAGCGRQTSLAGNLDRSTLSTEIQASSTSSLDRSTPDVVIRAYFEAANQQSPELMGAVCAVDPHAEQIAREAMQGLVSAGVRYTATDVQWYVIEDTGSRLRVRADYQGTTSLGDTIVEEGPTGSWLTLVQIEGNWYVDCAAQN